MCRTERHEYTRERFVKPILIAFVALLGLAGRAAAAQDAATEATLPAVEEAPAPDAAAQEAAPAAVDADEAEAEKAEAPKAEPPKGGPHGGGIDLGYGLRLNGKFDAAYEYGGFSKFDEGKNDLKNYHHFVFISRQSKDDPFFFSAEVIERYFYEFGARFKPNASAFSYSVRAGKVMVPFGGEPLFHHSYGGLTGFDQPVLPVVWSQIGAIGNVQFRGPGFRLSNDLYGVQGYGLETTNEVLNLQTGFSKPERLKAGFGDRLGFGMGPISVWYSAYLNDLGHKRLLFMQGLDAEVFRATDIPVVKNFVLGAGIMRADVSGGEKNMDYYHFADYVTVRYYILDELSVEGRTGLRTFENRNHAYKDDRRFDEKDASAHNLTLQYKRSGFVIAAQRFWNYEKRNEIPNDLIRVRTGYEF